MPDNIETNAGVIVFVDQIASGERLLGILKLLQTQEIEARRLRVITVLASSPGLKQLGEMMPNLTIHPACIDPALTEDGEISPGIGNPVLRLNTRTAGKT